MIKNETRNQFIASTILEQLGGNKFLMMTGAKNLMSGDARLIFALPGTPGFVKDGINKVRVQLEANDTYTVTGFRVRGLKVDVKAVKSDVYNEDLKRVFTEMTELYVSL